MNKNPLIALLLVFITGISLGSCDTTADVDYELSRNCIVNTASLGTLERTIHTLSSTGADSTYVAEFNAASYPLYIDQLNNRIYNADSLPVGTNLKKIVFENFGVTGWATIKMLEGKKDTLFSYRDTTDFSRPRTITVHSADGNFTRDYTVEIRVHNEKADSFVWQKITPAANNLIAGMVESRSMCVGNDLLVFGKNLNGNVLLIQTPTNAPEFNHSTELPVIAGQTIDIQSVLYFKGTFYALAGGKLISTKQATAGWSETGVAQTFESIIGMSSDSIYAIADNKIYASANTSDWTPSAIDTEGMLPHTNIATIVLPSATNPSYENIILTGKRESMPVVWMRNIDRSGEYTFPWMLLPQTEELGNVAMPTLQFPNMIAYDNNAMLAGITTDGKLAPFYTSYDNGRTWKSGELLGPEAQAGITAFSMTVDSNNYVWLICHGTGEILKGRINRLGWNEEPHDFEKIAPHR